MVCGNSSHRIVPAALVPGLPAARARQLPPPGLPATHGSGRAVASHGSVQNTGQVTRRLRQAWCRSRAPRRAAVGAALQTDAVADQREVRAFWAGLASRRLILGYEVL
jgi:hypothetical protein